MTTPPARVTPTLAAALLVATAGCGSPEQEATSPETDAPANSATASASESTAEPTASPSATPSPTSSPSPTEAEQQVVITIKDFAYMGPDSVAPGTKITVENQDDVVHTVTAEGDGGFDVTIDPGASATFAAPSEPGEYPYDCSFHANMSGTLVVS